MGYGAGCIELQRKSQNRLSFLRLIKGHHYFCQAETGFRIIRL